MKKVMLLAAVVAMVMAAAVPAFAQNVGQVGQGNVACVQTAVQNNIVGDDSVQGSGNAQANQYGDNIIANNISNEAVQAVAQECNIAVEQVNTIVNEYLTVNKAGEVVVVDYYKDYYKKDYASASAPAKYEYKYEASAPAAVQYEYKYEATASAHAASASAHAAELPETGGSSLIALGAGVLLVAGGLLARRIVR